MKKLVISFIITIIILSLIIYLLFTSEHHKVREFGFELLKISSQLVLIGVFGNLLIQKYNQRREIKEALNDFRKSVLSDLIKSYFDVKKSRRILRASFSPKNVTTKKIAYKIYQEQMHQINDSQLRFEILIHEINTFREAFSDSDTLKANFKIMEKYLHKISDEYEETDIEENLTIENLTHLERFIRYSNPNEINPFKTDFSSVFHNTVELIRKESLKV